MLNEHKFETGHAKPKFPVATYNKDRLLNTYFEHTDLFSAAGQKKLQTGKYCDEVIGSKPYKIFWEKQLEYLKFGFENPVTKVRITPYHYYFLNFKPMRILENPNSEVSRRIMGFPRFWPIHYWYLKSIEEADIAGVHNITLKPRGTGFSELHAGMAAKDYLLNKEDPTFFFASHERFLVKDGILPKVWETIDYMNAETEMAFFHLSDVKNGDLHRKASFWDTLKNAEIKTGGEVIGQIVDLPKKVRGARGKVNFEEAGSFPVLMDSWIACRALVEQGGVTFARMMAWGTGGESGAGIIGLEQLFKNPVPNKCLAYENCWTDDIGGGYHGFFFPTWSCLDRFMDKWGNMDYRTAKEWCDDQRDLARKQGALYLDKFIAEYPYTPDEALMRSSGNPFPVAELRKQHTKITTHPDHKGLVKHGSIYLVEGTPQFELNSKAKPLLFYPHNQAEPMEGCFSILESPISTEQGIPANIYYVIVDPYAYDDVEDHTSLGAAYVYKRSSIHSVDGDMLVAWYVGRPSKVSIFQRNVFYLARYYNAKVQSELRGGGKSLLDFAKENNLLQYCDYRPAIFTTDKEELRLTQRPYFINVDPDLDKVAIEDLADWLMKERAAKIEGEETRYILNLEMIYDPALLEELIKYNPKSGNFDRLSAVRLLMLVRREFERQPVEEKADTNRNSVYNRPLFTDTPMNHSLLKPHEMPPLGRHNYSPPPGGDMII